MLRDTRDRIAEHFWRFVAPDRAGHLDRDTAVAVLERRTEEVRPVGADPGALFGIGIETERFGMLADIPECRDDLSVRRDGLERGHQLVVDKGIRRPALTKVRGLDRLRVLETRRSQTVVCRFD